MKKILALVVAIFSLVAGANAQYVNEYVREKEPPRVQSDLLSDPWATARFFGPVKSVGQTNLNYDTLLSNLSVIYSEKDCYAHNYKWSCCPMEVATYTVGMEQIERIYVVTAEVSAYCKVHYRKKNTPRTGYVRWSGNAIRRPLHKEKLILNTLYEFKEGRPVSKTVTSEGKGVDVGAEDEHIRYDSLRRPFLTEHSFYYVTDVCLYTYNDDDQIIKADFYDFSNKMMTSTPRDIADWGPYLTKSISFFYENGKYVKNVEGEKETDVQKSFPQYESETGPWGPVFYKGIKDNCVAAFCNWKKDLSDPFGPIGKCVDKISYTYDDFGNPLSVTYELHGGGSWENRWEYTYDRYGNWLTRNYYEGNVLRQRSERDIEYVGGNE